MSEHIISLLFFAAAMQGFLLAGVLGFHKRNIQANHILAVWIALLSIDLLGQIFYLEAIYLRYPQLIGFTNFLPLTYGTFLFLYVRSLTQSRLLSYRDLMHFSGFFIGIAINSYTFIATPAQKLQLIADIMANKAPWGITLINWLVPAYASVYAIYASVLLWRYTRESSSHHMRLRWLHLMMGLNLVIWMVVWASSICPDLLPDQDDQIIYFLVSLLIYTLGYFSLRQPELFATAKNATPKYGDNRLPDDLREQILTELEQHMRDQSPWRDSNFSLAQLAENTGFASHHISQVLNDHHGQSFSDYLNQYRVNAICQQLSESQPKNLLDVALECGFSSKSSFNAAFKKYTGKTPSEYRKQVQN